jgi:hypothetical protein
VELQGRRNGGGGGEEREDPRGRGDDDDDVNAKTGIAPHSPPTIVFTSSRAASATLKGCAWAGVNSILDIVGDVLEGWRVGDVVSS